MRSLAFGFLVSLCAWSWIAAADPLGTVPTGWLGLGYQCRIDPIEESSFLIVLGTAPESAAREAGLEPHDLIVEVDGEPVRCADQAEAMEIFRELEAGQEVSLVVSKGDRRRTVVLVADEATEDQRDAWKAQYERQMKQRRIDARRQEPAERKD